MSTPKESEQKYCELYGEHQVEGPEGEEIRREVLDGHVVLRCCENVTELKDDTKDSCRKARHVDSAVGEEAQQTDTEVDEDDYHEAESVRKGKVPERAVSAQEIRPGCPTQKQEDPYADL